MTTRETIRNREATTSDQLFDRLSGIVRRHSINPAGPHFTCLVSLIPNGSIQGFAIEAYVDGVPEVTYFQRSAEQQEALPQFSVQRDQVYYSDPQSREVYVYVQGDDVRDPDMVGSIRTTIDHFEKALQEMAN